MSVTAAWTASYAHDGGSVERERRGGAEAWSGPMRNSSKVVMSKASDTVFLRVAPLPICPDWKGVGMQW